MSVLDVFQEASSIPEMYRTMSDDELKERVAKVKASLGERLYMPGHHYQKNEVIQFTDERGDSLQLARQAADQTEAAYIVFCGVHFMAETADILTTEKQRVFLPDHRAGCSMADMADLKQTERAWEKLSQWFGPTVLPLTYVNSTAAIKAFCGKRGGATLTSSNAGRMLEWAFEQKERILFLPDQHLGRNTAYELGIGLDEMAVWDPMKEELVHERPLEDIRIILWKGHCSVHEKFTTEQIKNVRSDERDRRIIVHPECTWDVVQQADESGSTKKIIDTIQAAPANSKWAVGTEMNLVNRLAEEHPHLSIHSLNPAMCPCLTMNRIDLAHLAWCLDHIAAGTPEPQHEIQVPKQVQTEALQALERMLAQA
ncbi:quinolinate synthetase [Salsuginibacillus halophilus]|uniref:Quinolinate synthase n=1 Tax=Salsuginibacillus halophilus TaxID=517424 RepID=A0A2P8HFY0_9BACI|nr:quinolinate synthase NadA [Salsuginibacillus halophilus]PSL45129.1 quinolinate synthetase [Salsuginibacillus halophilus]